MEYGESGGGVGVNGPSAAALLRFAAGRSDGSPSLYCSSFIVRLRAGIICKDGNPRSQKRDLGHPGPAGFLFRWSVRNFNHATLMEFVFVSHA